MHHPSRLLVLHVCYGANLKSIYRLSQFYICNKIIKLIKVTISFVCNVNRVLLTTDLVLPRTAESLDGFRGVIMI